MYIAQRAHNFEFDDDLILDQQVGGLFANNHLVAKDHDPPPLHPDFRISCARAFW